VIAATLIQAGCISYQAASTLGPYNLISPVLLNAFRPPVVSSAPGSRVDASAVLVMFRACSISEGKMAEAYETWGVSLTLGDAAVLGTLGERAPGCRACRSAGMCPHCFVLCSRRSRSLIIPFCSTRCVMCTTWLNATEGSQGQDARHRDTKARLRGPDPGVSSAPQLGGLPTTLSVAERHDPEDRTPGT
jgi:endogenous inhibitor of DNA gyrase (YacG/DUF329 family)